MFRFMLIVWSLAFTAGAARAEGDPPRKPNVLFIICDDLNNDLGCYGNLDVRSPNIDKLAQRGVRFDRAYCQYPQCNPSRTSFLSGLRPDSTQVFNNDVDPQTKLPRAVLLPEYFQKNGYYTACFGKVAHYPRFLKADVVDGSRKGGSPQPGQAEADARTVDGQIASRAVELMTRHKDRPFFVTVGFHKPHVPLTAPANYHALYTPDKLRLINPPPGYPSGVPAAALDTSRGKAGTDAQRRKTVADYYACVTFVDAQVGVLLDALDRLQLRDRTIVVLIGDHGWLHGEHGGEGKQSLFEQAARAPLIVAAPGKQPGAVSPRLVEYVDIYPTLAEVCGLPAPHGLEGTSFVPLLDDPERAWKKAAFVITARSPSGKAKRGRDPKTDLLARSVRTERYVFNDWGDGKSFELYDRQTDPNEYRNLASDAACAGVVAEMKAHLNGGWRAALPPAK